MKPKKWWVWGVAMAVAVAGNYVPVRAATEGANAAPATSSGAANLSAAAAEVIRLSGSGVGEDVVLAYVQNSQAPFSLSVDDVLYLKDVGLSSAVISGMLNRDAALRNQPQAAPPSPAPVTETTTEEPAVVRDAPADVTYFYDDLQPYGTWVDLSGVGWCW